MASGISSITHSDKHGHSTTLSVMQVDSSRAPSYTEQHTHTYTPIYRNIAQNPAINTAKPNHVRGYSHKSDVMQLRARELYSGDCGRTWCGANAPVEATPTGIIASLLRFSRNPFRDLLSKRTPPEMLFRPSGRRGWAAPAPGSSAPWPGPLGRSEPRVEDEGLAPQPLLARLGPPPPPVTSPSEGLRYSAKSSRDRQPSR
eukprot:COSAG05_NODE_214_length_13907_cov_28.992178_9_plen_201_part_00